MAIGRSFQSKLWVLVLAVLALTTACTGGDNESTEDPLSSASDTGEATDTSEAVSTADQVVSGSFVEINGQVYPFNTTSECTFSDDYWGLDFRRISLTTDGGYPGISASYAPPVADAADLEDPNVLAVFPPEESWWYTTEAATVNDYQVTLTDNGLTGSATLGVAGEGGPDGEHQATFTLSCDNTAYDAQEDSIDSDDGDPASGSGAPATDDIGSVTWAGQTTDLVGPTRSDYIVTNPDGDASSIDFDFEICETVNPGIEGDFNIGATLNDGTEFRLSGNIHDDFADHEGLFLGELPDEERAEDLDVQLDNRTLFGSATTSQGAIEFSFTC